MRDDKRVERFRSRGIHYFTGRVKCPMAGAGSRGPYESNRLALDDARTEVTIDRGAGRITVHNTERYARKTIIADLLFLADGTTVSGAKTPFNLHLKIMKAGDKISLDLHRHLRMQEPLVAAEFEPFDVVVTDGVRSQFVLTRQKSLDLICRPSLALRLVKSIMTTRNHLGEVNHAPDAPGFRIADLSVGFHAFRFEWMVARAHLASLRSDNAALMTRGSIVDMLREGAWEFAITALSDRWLPEVVKRDLFLFGLDELPLLQGVRERGLEKGQTLSFRFDRGHGEVGLGSKTEELPGALDVARAYLEFHMLGGLVTAQAEHVVGSLSKGS